MEAIHRDMYFLTKFYIWITLSTGQILHSWDQVTACYLNSIKAKIDRKNFVVDKCSHPIATVLIQPHTFSTVQINQQQTSQSETSGKISLQPDSWIRPHSWWYKLRRATRRRRSKPTSTKFIAYIEIVNKICS